MAVNTTTNQVYIPGFETNISSVVTPIAYTTTAAVTSLQSAIPGQFSTLTNKIANPATSRDDSEVSPYPLFGIWTNQDNSRKAGYSVINSDFQVVATSRLNNRQGGWTDVDLSGLNNWYEDFRGQTYTNGNPGSNNWSTHSGGGTNMNGHEGNMLYSLQVFGNYGNTQMNRQDQWGQFTSRSGTIIGVRGVRERLNHYSNDSTFQVRLRGSVYGYIDQVNLNSATYATWAGRTNRGMSSYNDRTKTLAVAESNTANQIRLHIWRNTNTGRSLNSWNYAAGDLHNFLSEAKTAGPSLTAGVSYSFYDFTWSSAGSTQGEPSYVMRLTMGDNGTIGFSRNSQQGNAQQYGWYIPTNAGTAGNSGLGAFTDSGSNLGNTTSYGIDQRDGAGIRTNISWDNQWLIAYAPYYYYHSGINAHCINTADPTKYYYWRNTDTSNGLSPVPFGESSFIMCYSVQNGDSPGPHLYIAQPQAAFEFGRRADNSTITNGGDLQPFNIQAMNYIFDTMSNTTQYPHITVMPHWTTV
jgi:hypothetical protein